MHQYRYSFAVLVPVRENK